MRDTNKEKEAPTITATTYLITILIFITVFFVTFYCTSYYYKQIITNMSESTNYDTLDYSNLIYDLDDLESKVVDNNTTDNNNTNDTTNDSPVDADDNTDNLTLE